MTDDNDQTTALLGRWHTGDREALLQLVARDRAWIETKVRARRGELLQRHGETLDDVQDLMIEVLDYAPPFVTANRAQFRALLARMLENQLIDKVRGHARRQALWDGESFGRESRLSLDPALPRPTQPDAAAARNEELAWMRLGLEFLDADERDLVRRRQFEEQSFAEIGDALEAAPDAVRKRFHRAVLRLAGIVQNLQAGRADTYLDIEG